MMSVCLSRQVCTYAESQLAFEKRCACESEWCGTAAGGGGDAPRELGADSLGALDVDLKVGALHSLALVVHGVHLERHRVRAHLGEVLRLPMRRE